MIAFLLSDSMDPFYQNISSFPTAIFSVLLVLCALYWAGAVLGLIDLEVIDIDFDGLDLNTESGFSASDAIASVAVRMGLSGVPAIVSLSLVSLIGWLICYYIVHFAFGQFDSGWLRYLLGIPVFFGSGFLAMLVSAVLIKPLRPLFASSRHKGEKALLGKIAVVRTSKVDTEFGEAVLNDGGAGLIIKVRSRENEQFVKDDRVVLFEKIGEGSEYLVISEEEFGPRGERL